jgi:hypothetical protein
MSYIDRIHKLLEILKPILHMPHPNHYTNSITYHTGWWLWNSPGGSQWLCQRLCESSSRIWVTRQELRMGWCFHFYIFLWVTSWWCSSQTRYFLWDCFTAHPKKNIKIKSWQHISEYEHFTVTYRMGQSRYTVINYILYTYSWPTLYNTIKMFYNLKYGHQRMGLKFLVINFLRREQIKLLGGYCKTDCNK